MTEKITTTEQLKAMSPDQIEAARAAGLIDVAAIGKERADADLAARRKARQIGARIRAGLETVSFGRNDPPAAG